MATQEMSAKTKSRIEEIIRGCPIFDGIDPWALAPVYQVFPRGSEITELYHQTPCVGIIGSGEADVYTISTKLAQPNVSTQSAGCVFGICNVYVQSAMPTRLICKRKCEVVFLPKTVFRVLIAKDAAFQTRYLTLCNEKILYLADKIELMGIHTAKGKLAAFLLQKDDGSGDVSLKVSKEQLAKFLSISRASLFRAIADLSNQNLIRSNDRDFQIINREALMAIRRG